MPRWFKIVGYPSWFFFAFLVSLYLTFPIKMVKGAVIEEGEKALGKGKPGAVGRYGVDPEITIGSLGLYRGSGLSLERVTVRLPSKDPDPGPEIDIDEVDVRVGIFSLLTGTPSITFDGRMWDGDFSGEVDIDTDTRNPKYIDFEVEGMKFESSRLILEKAGVPLTGTADLTGTIEMGDDPSTEGNGDIDISVKRLTVGPGERKIPMFGAFTVPLIDLGALTGVFEIREGAGVSKDLKLSGGSDANAELDVDLSLNKRLGSSRLGGGGSFLLEDKFLKDNPKFGTLLSFELPGLSFKKAKDDEGRYHFNLKGTLSNPRPALSRSAGKDRKSAPKKKRRKKSKKK